MIITHTSMHPADNALNNEIAIFQAKTPQTIILP